MCLEEAERFLELREWNLGVRRAQEAVELFLKGMLKKIGIEFPKVHDIGRFFVKSVKEKGIRIEEREEKEIIRISQELCSKRAPAFYWEKEFTMKDATQAVKDAKWIKEFINKINGEAQ